MESQGITKIAFVVVLVLFMAGSLFGLFNQAKQGDTLAVAVLVSLATLILIIAGAGITVGAIALQGQVQQRIFRDNAMENLSMLQQQARAQNELTKGAMRIARDQQRMLPASGTDPLSLVDVEDGIFEELEGVE
jgi:apolipoprotein N-acyltransferase